MKKYLGLFLTLLLFLVSPVYGQIGNGMVQGEPSATESVAGIAKLATTDQATAGLDDTTIMTPADTSAAIAAIPGIGAAETYGSGWNTDTGTPQKNDIYDYLHLLDTNDDGDIDTIDSTLWATKVDKAGDTFTGDVGIGSTSAGKNLTVNATLGSELLTWNESSFNEDDATWTMTGTGALVHVTGNTTTVTGTVSITAGTTYAVTFAGTGGGGTATYTLGGVTGTTIAASGAIAFTDYITASTTGALIITPASACTVSITSISVKALTDATGDATVDGNLTVRSQILVPQNSLPTTGAYPQYSELGNIDTGFGFRGGQPGMFYDGTLALFATNTSTWLAGYLNFNSNAYIYGDAANTLGIRNFTNQQKLNVYNTAVSATADYERLAITGVQGSSLNLTCETNGTGADNLDMMLTPAGTGQLKNVAANITAGSGTGITVNDTGSIRRNLYKVTTTYAAYTDSDTTKGIVIATLPAKTKIVGIYADTTAAYTGGTVSACTLEVGITAEGAAQILEPHNVLAGAILSGDAEAELGASMIAAGRIQNGYLPSWTGTTAIYATLDSTDGNLNALTTGSTTFYIETERY
jgi:hypothetical protein